MPRLEESLGRTFLALRLGSCSRWSSSLLPENFPVAYFPAAYRLVLRPYLESLASRLANLSLGSRFPACLGALGIRFLAVLLVHHQRAFQLPADQRRFRHHLLLGETDDPEC